MLKKIIHFPLTKIVIGFFVVGIVYGVSQNALDYVLNLTAITKDYKNLITGIISSILAIFAYSILYKYYEKRTIDEFSTLYIVKDLTYGISLGAILQSLTILTIFVLGVYKIESVNSLYSLIPALTIGFTSAIFEEILLRGIVFRITEEKLGSYIALLISALFFGVMHLGNPNSSLIAASGIAIQAGLLLGVAYMFTRNLWFPIAIHFAWNFTQAGIYGASVSGHEIERSLFTSKIEGVEWLTGGTFGPEGSIQATIFCVIAMVFLLHVSHKKGNVILPYWKKNTNS